VASSLFDHSFQHRIRIALDEGLQGAVILRCCLTETGHLTATT
jgi:hypothetical protein